MAKKIHKVQKQPGRPAKQASRAMRTPSFQPAIVQWRYVFMCLVLICLGAAVVWKVASIQVMPQQARGYEFLQRYGQSQFVHNEVISATRGVITDRQGEPLAVSSTMVSICANPQVLLKNRDQWRTLANALSINEKQLADRIQKYRNKDFMYLKRHLPPSQAKQVLERDLPGVFSREEYQRFYPAGEVAAHLVGMTNIDDMGQEGLELGYNEWLRGVPGLKQVAKDLKGRTIDDLRLVRAAQPGKELQLSIDLRLQYLAYRELKSAVTRHNAVAGSIVILDSKTGEVLAMVNQPSYNPNNRAALNSSTMKNRALTDQFEPGSTMKPFTVLAALATGKYKPHSLIDTSPGRFHMPGKTVFDPVNYGVLSVSDVISESSQVGITKIALDLEAATLRHMFHRVGFGQSIGTGFPGETTGSLPNHEKWHPVEQATLAYGYGVTVNTLQLAQAYSVFANGGLMKPVSILKLSEKQRRQLTGERIVEKHYADQVLSMLAGVLESGGTGTRAQLESYTAGGKTGTAHKAAGGSYLDEAKFSVFAGIAPLNNPRIVVAILIDEPREGLYGGGEVAAPIFGRVAEEALRVLQVPPDKLSNQLFTGREAGEGPLS